MCGSTAMMLLALFVGASAVQLDAENGKNRPVTKVINLLKDMIAQLEKEGEEDEEVYEVMGCWCKTNDKEKTKQIADGEDKIGELSNSIEELTAKAATLNTEVANLNSEVAKNTEALESATALRDKQLAEFNVEEKDMLQSILSLKGAVVALSNHHTAAFLQSSLSARELNAVQIAADIQHQLGRHERLLSEVITPHQRKLLKAFAAAPERYIGGQPILLQTGEPQSGEIFGILKAMKESFETNLSQSQKEETENAAAYEDLKIAKEAEIKAGTSQSDTKTQELAATEEKNAEAKQDLEDSRKTLAANIEYLTTLKDKCQNVDHEYAERSQTRQLEIQATSKALAFLSSDEAHDLFTRTFNPALVQQSRTAQTERRDAVVKALVATAKKASDPRVALLATSAKLNPAFEKVKRDIQDMIDKLIVEKEDEIKKKDFCIEEINSNEKDQEVKTRDKGDALAIVEDLKMNIDKLTVEIENTKVEIKETELQLKRAGIDREKQSKEFQVVVADQRATQKLIAASLDILKGFYDKAALVQTSTRVQAQQPGPPPPPSFKTYEKNASSGGVMGMMESIIADAKAMEEEAVRGEADAQADYETFVQETNAAIDALNEDMNNKQGAKGKDEAALVEATKQSEEAMDILEDLKAESRGLHLECDFVLKNFEIRQSTRDDEIESLKQSMSIFSGASFGAFLQHYGH